MTGPKNPHDALFRQVFSNPESAAGLFRAVLPAALFDQVEPTSLAVAPGSYVDTALRSSQSDLLFTLRLAGKPAYLYVLVEHQSTTDQLMPLRLLRYMSRIWERHAEVAGAGECALPLPLIVPVVIHHSETGWSAASRLEDLFDVELAERSGIGELRWLDAMAALAAAETGREALGTILRYLSLVAYEGIADTIITTLSQHIPEAEETLTTLAERWMSEGEARGRAEGRIKATTESVLAVLEARGLTVNEEQRARIEACSELEVLERWLRTAVTATSTSELFA